MPDTQVLDKVASNTTPEKHSFHSIHPSFKKRLRRFSFLMSTNLDRVMPSHRVYCGCNRRVLLIFCTVVFFVVLIAAIGLGLGLRKGSEYVSLSSLYCPRIPRSTKVFHRSQNLPLPSNSKSFKGDLTYYSPALGACGITSSDSDNICAVSHIVFDAVSKGSNPNANPLCGLKIRATRFDERSKSQRSVDLKVVDRCMPSGLLSYYDFDG